MANWAVALRALVALSTLWMCACGGAQVRASDGNGRLPGGAGCTLWLQAFSPGPGQLTEQRTLAGDYQIVSDRVCLRTGDGALRLPRDLTLHGAEKREMCVAGTEQQDVGPNAKAGASCKWNGVFRDRYPLSFLIYTASPDDRIDRHLRLVRVFRNGELAFRWIPGHEHSDQILIPGAELRGALLPHRAPLDLRLVPVGVSVPVELESEEVTRNRSHAAERLSAALTALKTSPVLRQGRLGCEISALEYWAKSLEQAAACLASAEKPCETELPARPTCQTNAREAPEPAAAQRLAQAFLASVKKGAANEIETAKSKVLAAAAKLDADAKLESERFKDAVSRYWGSTDHPEWLAIFEGVPSGERAGLARELDLTRFRQRLADLKLTKANDEITEDFRIWFRIRASGESLERLLIQSDRLMGAAGEVVALVETSARHVMGELQELEKDDAKAYALYNHFAVALDRPDLFQPRGENPAPIADELVLPMEYSDQIQVFFLAPWHAVPTRPDKKFQAAVNAGTAIPVIDVAGVRYQWGRSRFADSRAAIGVAGFGEEVAEASGESTSVFHFAAQGNVSLGTLHLGAAYVLTNGGGLDAGSERVRFLIGVDLVKLVTGRNIEVE